MKDILTRSQFEAYLRYNWTDISLSKFPCLALPFRYLTCGVANAIRDRFRVRVDSLSSVAHLVTKVSFPMFLRVHAANENETLVSVGLLCQNKGLKIMESQQIESVSLCSEDGDSSHMKRWVDNHKLIAVEFQVNNLSFYLERES